MFLVVTGNIDPKETINLVKINQENKKFDKFKSINLLATCVTLVIKFLYGIICLI